MKYSNDRNIIQRINISLQQNKCAEAGEMTWQKGSSISMIAAVAYYTDMRENQKA
jgi:hypothetical protein